MNYEITKACENEKVEFKNPSTALYEVLGYEGMRKLMYEFYERIYESNIAHFFPQDRDEFEEVKKKNTKFFIQICGGPSIYDEEMKQKDLNEYMIDIHKNFSIYEKSRDEWLGTFREVLKELHVDEEIKNDFWQYLDKFSKLTVNRYLRESAYV
ncbi:Truncated hemoglobin [Sulfurimonas denitrificans DSM 1251]|jgi:hemoglobin|uniref:Truncated hemoglobin n=1 Tax=Sulfurimonas denitrificans (strain ATCC 33889 / DSM 1251) TaxID=326298 RepID=Q30RW0_SULDN|nr:globin [Sulfurimonas denitrificans]ABB44271.1 Truncated hemoglobin [Sulfurimonas denitrificans DSM 1251]MDD3443105.1 globin [Sulfurimonas denitrificans]